jgi:hypothetical protein
MTLGKRLYAETARDPTIRRTRLGRGYGAVGVHTKDLIIPNLIKSHFGEITVVDVLNFQKNY